jgi:hexulose-6-phosphate isomerase
VTRIGIMQGRLVPPVDGRIQCFPRLNWADEFGFAAVAGLDCIEWIYDQFGSDVNPIATDKGIESMLKLSELHDVRVVSICADYFMDWPLVRASAVELGERLEILSWLIGRAWRLGVERIILPFVDASRIDTDAELQLVVSAIGRVLPVAEESGVELHLETSLSPERFAELLARQPSPLVKVNYDIGNSASLAYDPQEEFQAYGDRVGSIHIKDRLKAGGTVPLGTGDADFPVVFDCLRAVRYSGDFVLQVARGVPGEEVLWAGHNQAILGSLMAAGAASEA